VSELDSGCREKVEEEEEEVVEEKEKGSSDW
jgi:hypothetical protein